MPDCRAALGEVRLLLEFRDALKSKTERTPSAAQTTGVYSSTVHRLGEENSPGLQRLL